MRVILADGPNQQPIPIDGGALRVTTVPMAQAVALGLVTDFDPVVLTGSNADVDATAEGVWSPGGAMAFPAAAAGMELVSSDAKDDGDPAGVGARTVRVHYLDADYEPQTEDVTLNGVTAVATVADDILRVNRLEVLTVGSEGDPAGAIDIRALADTPIYEQIPAGVNESRGAKYTVPAGFVLVVTDLFISTDVAAVVTVQSDLTVQQELFRFSAAVGNTLLQPPALVIGETEDVWLEAACAAGNGVVTAKLWGYLRPA
jgi:hypothetical protein